MCNSTRPLRLQFDACCLSKTKDTDAENPGLLGGRCRIDWSIGSAAVECDLTVFCEVDRRRVNFTETP